MTVDSRDPATTLYRMYDAGGALLYVGISRTPIARVGREHRFYKSWWREVATITLTHFGDREGAARAELDAILTEDPKWNVKTSLDAMWRGLPARTLGVNLDRSDLDEALARTGASVGEGTE